MDFSTSHGADTRVVKAGEHSGAPTHIVQVSRVFNTTPDALWAALTTKSKLQKWFGDVSGDIKLSGRFDIAGNASGKILRCDAARRLEVTWEFGGNISWVRAELRSEGLGSALTLSHEMPMDDASEAHWAKYGPGATGVGWEMAILGLDAHLAHKGASVVEAGQVWAESAQGKALLRAWASAWGDAHIASGEADKTARAMAANTAGFYTGEG